MHSPGSAESVVGVMTGKLPTPSERPRVPLVAFLALASKFSRPLQAGLKEGRSELWILPITENYRGTDSRSYRL